MNKHTNQDITDKANDFINEWGFLCARVHAWKMKTFKMPPSVEYWEKVESRVQELENEFNKFRDE